MSILLDALKKSEEQRQLGNVPDVHAPSDHNPDKGRVKTPAWIPAVLMGVAAIVIFWFTWSQYREPETAAVSGEPVLAKRVPGVAINGRAAEPQSPEPGAARPARTPVETFVAPEEQKAEGTPPGNPAGEPARTAVAREFDQFQHPPPAEAAAQRQVPPSTAAAGPQQEPESRQAPAPQPSAGPREMGLISYWELPQSVRDGMPEIRITVMVYADEPADRFMLVNGQRLREKDLLDGVELEEIRRDGAVFRYRNYRFLVKG